MIICFIVFVLPHVVVVAARWHCGMNAFDVLLIKKRALAELARNALNDSDLIVFKSVWGVHKITQI